MKTLIAGLLVAGFSASAMAASYGSAGCGLGSLVFQGNGPTQILAATTNGTFGSQTFGLTFGTSNCNNKGLVKLGMQRESFIEANYKDLSRDAAAGKGEFVTNLASLYNIAPAKFTELLQKNHAAIFASNDAKTAVNEINRLVSSI
ncbi:MAG: DUF3015 family protein [Elusimicrobiota bacterium]